ncbi:serine hydrolase [Roseofilum casamattae]|uniref:Serine hydrolase n=1 Tax=Roseofilum casamattae BLCC-M143 TaxID=3022442 RepID=A0ABT7BX23_9CYAN|nr:serine hydrolase [Roseofilum casamattae]MDJ1183715.1 serine hydrolase [Roseofilum casamattae BLCC-M143]
MTFFRKDKELAHLGYEILETIWTAFPQLPQDRVALTWIVYDPPIWVNTGGAVSAEEFWKHPVRGFQYRGKQAIAPAYLVSLFYAVAIYDWIETQMAVSTPELERAIRDMVVDANHDAIGLVLDMLTGTTSGPELSGGPFETWKMQRNIVNRYFQSLGWPELNEININQKLWSNSAYGRDRIFQGEGLENDNRLTANATARLLHSIIGGVAVSAKVSQTLMELIQRPIQTSAESIIGFFGQALPPTAKLWSKSATMGSVRHESAYIELPNSRPYLLVVFTEDSNNHTLLPFISQQVVAAMNDLE